MSKLKMLKFEAAALQNKSKTLIEELQRTGVLEIERFDDNRLFQASTVDLGSRFEKSMDVVSESLGILSEMGVNLGGGMFSGRDELSKEEYENMSAGVYQILDAAYDICKKYKSIAELSAERTRLLTTVDYLQIWKRIDLPLNSPSTKYTVSFAGTFPREYTYETLFEALAGELLDVREYTFEIVHSSKEVTAVFFVCHKSVEKELTSAVRALSFVAPLECVSGNVRNRIAELEEGLKNIDSTILSAKEKIKSFESEVSKLKFAYDYFCIKRDEYVALANVKFSGSTIYIRGYVPEISQDRIKEIVEDNDGVVVFKEPSEDDDVPVIMSNGAFSEPVESIVEMYAIPGKKDIDPSKVMAFFYYLLFGMMLSDAGYGILMTIGTAILLKKTNVEGGMRKMLSMFFYCGISTTIWGALFGSWFGDIVSVIYTNFLGKPAPNVVLWFEPIKDPIKLLLFSFVIGIAHLFLGLVVFGCMKWREGDWVSAVFDTVPIMMMVLGAAPLAGSILTPMPAAVSNIAKYVLIAGIVLIVLTNSRSSKNIFARLGGGLYGLYNIASGYLSDILSYSRLLALGLATGSIASVVNMLGVMPQNMVLKTIVFIIVFIVGHSLNMAVNVLGAYVHTNRLQFVELFAKFYEGGGRAFEAFRFNTKYFKLKEENKND